MRGPKVRIKRFREGSVELEAGDTFTLDASAEPAPGDQSRVGVTYKGLAQDVSPGDLGVEIGDAELPGLQKLITRKALEQNCVVITATQMMQSMIESPIPTRAEVLDVANSVFDGTDAVMLSAETAVGRHPDIVVEAMNRICLEYKPTLNGK